MSEQATMTSATIEIALNVTAIASMLHEDVDVNSATRSFRGEPVLSWTLRRLQRARHVGNLAIICWDDQLPAVEEIAEEYHAFVLAKGPRSALPGIDFVAASRRWSDGWRGGLGNTCHFDRGFHGPSMLELLTNLESDAALLIDPAAGLLDAELIDRLIEHAAAHETVELSFTAAAPGLTGAIVRRPLLERLAKSATLPGRRLHYRPDQPMRDPIGTDASRPAAVKLARSQHSFLLDSDRQIARISAASLSLNGSLARSTAEQIVERFAWPNDVDALPRELVIELNTERLSKPIFRPGQGGKLDREMIRTEAWKKLFDEAASDDLRLTIAGAGDPLESAQLFDVIEAARSSGITAIQVVTDLLSHDVSRVEQLAASGIDVVSIYLPAMTAETYAIVMGIDAMTHALKNLAAFAQYRNAACNGVVRGVPIVAPMFIKLAANLGEMEAWYDQWLRAVGVAVIVGPSDFAGQMADLSVADMSPTRRGSCRRIQSRMNVLCDGTIVACEQDFFGRAPIGKVGAAPLKEIWRQHLRPLRNDHVLQQLEHRPLCMKCREWNRP